MSGTGRDEFKRAVVRELELAAGAMCCAPFCRISTTGGPSVIRIGEAAHITAAARSGPRYDETLSPEERTAPANGIWLCKNHARLIDVEVARYSPELLLEWKRIGEATPLTSARGDNQGSLLPTYTKRVPITSSDNSNMIGAHISNNIRMWTNDIGLQKAWGQRHCQAVEALYAELLLNMAQHSLSHVGLAHLSAKQSGVRLSFKSERFGPPEWRRAERRRGGWAVLQMVQEDLQGSLRLSHRYSNGENTWHLSVNGWPDDQCELSLPDLPTTIPQLNHLNGCSVVRLRIGDTALAISNTVELMQALYSVGVTTIALVDVEDSHFLAGMLARLAREHRMDLIFLGMPSR